MDIPWQNGKLKRFYEEEKNSTCYWFKRLYRLSFITCLDKKEDQSYWVFSYKKKPFNYQKFPLKSFIQVKGDIRSKKRLTQIFSKYKPNYCFHLAGKTTVEEGQDDPEQTYDVNINGAINILELSRTHKLEKVVIASTSHVYGDNPAVPYKEEYFPRPSRPYETSKTCVDLIAQSYADTFNMPIEIPRFVNIYGPGDVNFTRLIPKIMKQIILEGKVEIWGGEVVRDYLFIDDAISAYFSLLKNRQRDRNKIVNFGSGKPLSVKQLVKKIIKISGKKIPLYIKKKPDRKQEITEQYVSLQKSLANFSWRANVSLTDGLKKTIAWYNKYFNCPFFLHS